MQCLINAQMIIQMSVHNMQNILPNQCLSASLKMRSDSQYDRPPQLHNTLPKKSKT